MLSKELWFNAVRRRDYTFVSANLDKFKRVRDDLGFTGLMYAAWSNDVEMVRLLANDELNLSNGQGNTATIIAALNGSVDACQYLLTRETIGLNEFGHTPLTLAAAEGVTTTIPVLIPYYGTMKDSNGWTPLDHAASNGHIDAVKLLIADLSPRILSLESAIEHAILSKNTHIVELLTLCKDTMTSTPCTTCDYYRNFCASSLSPPLSYASEKKTPLEKNLSNQESVHTAYLDISLAKMEWAYTSQLFNESLVSMHNTRKSLATLNRYLSALVALLGSSEYVSQSSSSLQGATPLMIAASIGRADMIEDLTGEYLGKRNSQGLTALMIAARRGHMDCVKLLISEAKKVDMDGYTALMHAVMANTMDVADYLASYEGGIRCPDGNTALLLAVKQGYFKLPQSLIEVEAKIKDAEGNTALMYAVLDRNKQLISLLHKEEASISNSKGITALMAAAYMNDCDTISLTLSIGKQRRMHRGFTALMIAACLNNKEAVEALVGHEAFCVTDAHFSALLLAVICGSVDASRTLGLVEMSILSPHGHNAVELSTNGPCSSVISDICDGVKSSA